MKPMKSVIREAQPREEGRRLRASLPPKLRHWLREPLLHFLVIGVLLFAAFGYAHRGVSSPTSHKIQLTPEDLNQLEVYFVSQWHREPTAVELAGLVEDRVRDEVLYREALNLGLDKNDTIVKRRMAQKMEFLSEDMANAHEPSPAELKVWYSKNEQRFTQADQVSFRHLYFSSDRRGQRAYEDATVALGKIAGQPETSQAAALSDHFHLENAYEDQTRDELAKDFGLPFAQALFKAKPGSWQGPIQSGYGWHLVFVKAVTQGHAPNFEDIESDVKAAWLTEQRSQQWSTVYAAMRAKYDIVLPAGAGADAGRLAAAPSKPPALPSEAGEVR
jgi:peptidyl-prolyl cis-trans isomerase C